MRSKRQILTSSYILTVLSEKNWSDQVKTTWEPPEGFFTQSAPKIAAGLKSASKDLQQAMSRLNFYINRAGHNLNYLDKSACVNGR